MSYVTAASIPVLRALLKSASPPGLDLHTMTFAPSPFEAKPKARGIVCAERRQISRW